EDRFPDAAEGMEARARRSTAMFRRCRSVGQDCHSRGTDRYRCGLGAMARSLWPAAALVCATSLLLSAPAWPQAYPARPIKLIVPFPAGGPADFFSRVLAHGLSAELGQQIILENRTGAGGLAGVDSVAKS